MKTMLMKVMGSCASLALLAAISSVGVASDWLFHQPQVPERLQELVK